MALGEGGWGRVRVVKPAASTPLLFFGASRENGPRLSLPAFQTRLCDHPLLLGSSPIRGEGRPWPDATPAPSGRPAALDLHSAGRGTVAPAFFGSAPPRNCPGLNSSRWGLGRVLAPGFPLRCPNRPAPGEGGTTPYASAISPATPSLFLRATRHAATSTVARSRVRRSPSPFSLR